MVFLAQFRINLHEWVFRNAEITPSRFGKWNFNFSKNLHVQINSKLSEKTVWVLINNSHFSKLPHKIFVIFLRDMIDLKKVYCISANHNQELWCEICTGVFFFLHWCYTWTALLSAKQNGVFFMYIINILNTP